MPFVPNQFSRRTLRTPSGVRLMEVCGLGLSFDLADFKPETREEETYGGTSHPSVSA